MVEVNDVHKSFADKHILKGITATFQPGEINLVIGASGSGKSVLMKCMVGLIMPDEGHIVYDNRDFTSLDYKAMREVRREIGMLFQGGALFDSSTVQENVEFPLKMFTKMTPEERMERVNFCLKCVQLEGVNKKYPAEISGGMKKRVGIARAIALDIKYLFCDEPNSGLDPVTSRVIDGLIRDITKEFGITTVINTHDMKTVFDIGDSILFIHNGHNWWNGKKEDVKRSENAELIEFINASHFG
ncbi:MAG: ATP-binding cassette domain-containing protein [Flavobacteriales bacterium]|nr:ATP-binding cassette domain-containing protein [Flavobacteriales bacterium]